MRTIWLLPLVLLAGCSALANAPPVFRYHCDGGKHFVVVYDEANDIMTVTTGDVAKALPRAMSASGARYARGDFEYWSKGREAMLSGFPGGPYENCREGGW